MENSMPNILLNVCIDNNIKCKYLKKYINNRQKYINEVQQFYNVTKDQAKELFIMLTFNGSYLTWLKKYTRRTDKLKFVVAYAAEVDMLTFNGSYSTWLKKYKTSRNDTIKFVVSYAVEMDKIASYIIENNQELYKYIIDNKNPKHPKASVYSYYTLEYEYRILECVYLFLIKKKIINDNVVLSHDGFMIPNKIIMMV